MDAGLLWTIGTAVGVTDWLSLHLDYRLGSGLLNRYQTAPNGTPSDIDSYTSVRAISPFGQLQFGVGVMPPQR